MLLVVEDVAKEAVVVLTELITKVVVQLSVVVEGLVGTAGWVVGQNCGQPVLIGYIRVESAK